MPPLDVKRSPFQQRLELFRLSSLLLTPAQPQVQAQLALATVFREARSQVLLLALLPGLRCWWLFSSVLSYACDVGARHEVMVA